MHRIVAGAHHRKVKGGVQSGRGVGAGARREIEFVGVKCSCTDGPGPVAPPHRANFRFLLAQHSTREDGWW